MGEVARTGLRNKITEQGYILIPDHRPSADIVDVANELGTSLTPWEGGLVQTLIPREDAAPNTYSGNFGLRRFPFHTDLAHWRRPPCKSRSNNPSLNRPQFGCAGAKLRQLRSFA